MAKEGIDSFLLDCHTNDNLSEIEATFGLKGFAVIVRLWQKIYSEKGYYCEWTERSPALFLSRWFGVGSGVDVNFIKEVVAASVRIGIFDPDMYGEYSILTSGEIQERYFDVVKKRPELNLISEYLLVSVANFRGNAHIKSIFGHENGKTGCLKESKVKESKVFEVKESKEKERKASESEASYCSEPAEPDSEPPAISIPLNDGTEYPVMMKDVDEWKDLYPAVDVMQELRNMKGWCDSNPKRRKTRGGARRFINNWLKKEQDRGGSGGQAKEAKKRTVFDEWMDA